MSQDSSEYVPLFKLKPAEPTPQISHVQFYNDTIQAITANDGELWLSLSNLCAKLGLNLNAQRQRLIDTERSPWAVICQLPTIARDGRRHRTTCMDLETLTMWLATISSGHVRGDGRDKIIRYQNECARVVRAHFFGARIGAPRLSRARDAVPRKEKHVYFIQNTETQHIKIGVTRRLGVRLGAVRAGAGAAVILLGVIREGGYAKEKELHDRFAGLRTIGEWFSPGGDLLAFIASSTRLPKHPITEGG